MGENGEKVKSRSIRQDLSSARTYLMGFAIVSVVMFHVRARSICPEWRWALALNQVIGAGHGGCDIFLFLSGFGLVHSLEKDADLGRYLRRRAEKLLPAYYPFILVYIGAVLCIRGITVKEAMGNLLFFGTWLQWGNQFNWYIQMAVACYLLAPAVFWLLRSCGSRWKGVLLLVLFAVGLQLLFLGKYQLIAISRVPVFLMGMLLGTAQARWLSWTAGKLLLLAAAFVGGAWFFWVSQPCMTWENGLYWYPFILLAPAVCLLTAAVRPLWLKVPALRAVDRLVCLCGTCSLEIYLVHLLLFETLFIQVTGNRFWLAMAAVGIGLGIGYHYVVQWAVKWLTRKAGSQTTGGTNG